jgi:hypothetical protein
VTLDQKNKARAEFESARRRSSLRTFIAALRGRSNRLLSFDDVRAQLPTGEPRHVGLEPVALEDIVGCVDRCEDFDRSFLPKRPDSRGRWMGIALARLRGQRLPPVQLSRVGDAYFVIDGNHRVSVARTRGQRFIDAQVVEYPTRVAIETTLSSEQIRLKAEYARFLEHTNLDNVRPDQHVEFSVPGGYDSLEEHIRVHRYYLGLEKGRKIWWEQAVSSWYDNVYMPQVGAIRSCRLQRNFRGLTEADLYLRVMDHRYYLNKESGSDVGPEAAARDFGRRFGERGRHRFARDVWCRIRDITAGLSH